MDKLPLYVEIFFSGAALFTFLMLHKAGHFSRRMIVILICWLSFQVFLSLTGFYAITDVVPPRFGLALIPPMIMISILFFTGSGRLFLDQLNLKTLQLLHVVRIPVEITLYWLFIYKLVPEVMTFEGRNWDIFSGLSAPFIYYFGYIKNNLGRKILIAWNILCLLLLINIVFTAIFSAPFPFQRFGFEQPNVAMLYFPFVWLPSFIVPAVFFSHLVSLRELITGGRYAR